jgi:hypothetical protein
MYSSSIYTHDTETNREMPRLILLAFNTTKDGLPLKWKSQSSQYDEYMQYQRTEAWHKIQARENTIRDALQRWETRFDTYLQNSPGRQKTQREAIYNELLLLQSRSIYFWLLGSLDRTELMYDNYLARFRAAVAGAREALELMERSGNVAAFSFELGLLPPLYIIIQKCRDPLLRREALGLLRRSPEQEGLWNRNILTQVCERIIELEEGSDGFIDHLPPDMAEMIIPEPMRLKLVKIGLRTTDEDGRRGDLVEFYSLPHGFGAEWCVSREFFVA